MSTCLAYCTWCEKNTVHHDTARGEMTCQAPGDERRAKYQWAASNNVWGDDGSKNQPKYICANVSNEPPMYQTKTGEMVKA